MCYCGTASLEENSLIFYVLHDDANAYMCSCGVCACVRE